MEGRGRRRHEPRAHCRRRRTADTCLRTSSPWRPGLKNALQNHPGTPPNQEDTAASCWRSPRVQRRPEEVATPLKTGILGKATVLIEQTAGCIRSHLTAPQKSRDINQQAGAGDALTPQAVWLLGWTAGTASPIKGSGKKKSKYSV